MYNTQTDGLGLIESILVDKETFLEKLPLPLFERTLVPLPGKQQEVFRGGVPTSSVLPLNTPTPQGYTEGSTKVRKGDIIYRISVRPKLHPIVGTILTRDRYQRLYEINITWQASNPLQCAYMYHRGEDPTRKAMVHFKATFQKYASEFDHNKLDTVQFPFEQWAESLRELYGITALCTKPVFRFDDKKTREDKVHQDARFRIFAIEEEEKVKGLEEDIRMRQERLQKEFMRDEKRKENEFTREEKLKSHINEARIKLLDQSIDELVRINKERLNDAADSNGSFKSILEDSLRLLLAFRQLPPGEEREIVDESLQTDLPLLDQEI